MAAKKPLVVSSGGVEQIQAGDSLDAVNVTSGADPGHTHSIYLKADGTVALTGNMAVDAAVTIDGRDISVDGAALDVLVAAVAADAYLKADGTVPLTGDWTTGIFSIIGSDHWYMRADSKRIYFGAGDDGYIEHDGTNLIVNPQAVGTGGLYVSSGTFAVGTENPVASALMNCVTYPVITASPVYGLRFLLQYGAAGSGNMAQSVYGMYFAGGTSSAWNGNLNNYIYAMYASVDHRGSGNVSRAYGCIASIVLVAGAGNITDAICFSTYMVNQSITGSVITNAYGVNVNDVTAGSVLNYAIYTRAGYVYFGDNVGIGVAAPDSKLHVLGNIHLNDNHKFYVGTGKDGSIYHNGTDMLIFPDEVGSGVLRIHGNMVFTAASKGLPYAGIYAHDVGTTITITSSGEANKVQVTAFAADEASNLMTPDHTNDHITAVKTGVYSVKVSISATSTGGTAYVIGFGCWKNNGATEFLNLHTHRDLAGGGGDTGSITLSGNISLTAGDTLELWCFNLTNTNDIIIEDVTMSAVMVGG